MIGRAPGVPKPVVDHLGPVEDEEDVTPLTAVGLDLSLASTGWAAWGGDVGRIRTDIGAAKQLKGIPRRRYIAEEVERLIWSTAKVPRWTDVEEDTFRNVLVVIENHVAGAATRQTAIGLGQLHAVVLDVLGYLCCPIVYVAPATAKKHLAGSGKADKGDMIGAAQACGYQGNQTDEADAYGLAMLGHHLLGGTDYLTPHRQSCLAAVEWLVPLPEVAS